MKKIVAAVLALFTASVFIFVFTCDYDYPIEVDSDYITSGIYAYYLNEVMANLGEYDIEENDEDSIALQAVQLCMQYQAVINFMSEYEIYLSQSYKSSVADDTDSIWGMFSNFYSSVGIEKTDITKIITYEYSKRQLIEYYYGQEGFAPVSDEDLIEMYCELYVGFKAIEASTTQISRLGEVIDLSDSEKETLKLLLNDYASQINDGEITIDDANELYNQEQGLVVTSSLSSIIIQDENPMYDEDFFSMIVELEVDTVSVIETASTYYLLLKLDITDDDTFLMHREDVLYELKIEYIEEKAKELSEDYEPTIHWSLADSIYNKVESARS